MTAATTVPVTATKTMTTGRRSHARRRRTKPRPPLSDATYALGQASGPENLGDKEVVPIASKTECKISHPDQNDGKSSETCNPDDREVSWDMGTGRWLSDKIFDVTRPDRSSSNMSLCLLRRSRSGGPLQRTTFYDLFSQETDSGIEDKHVLRAIEKASMQKNTASFLIFDMSSGAIGTRFTEKSGNYIGSLRSNSGRNEYLFSSELPCMPQNGQVVGVLYKKSGVLQKMKGGRPRDVFVSLNSGGTSNHADDLLEKVRRFAEVVESDQAENAYPDATGLFRNKLPAFDGKYYRLEFGGRVKLASIKNFQLIRQQGASNSAEVVVQFGKVSSDDFHCDFRAPFSRKWNVCLLRSRDGEDVKRGIYWYENESISIV